MTRESIPRFPKFKPNSNHIIWAIYATLLGVLWPHTAWAFAKFEPSGDDTVSIFGVPVIAWALAAVFELALGVFTHELARHNNGLPDDASFKDRYQNVYATGLIVAWLVSTMANLAHSFEYASSFIVADYAKPIYIIYAVSFGAVLPLMSALFARVLARGETVSRPVKSAVKSQSKVASNEPSKPKPKRVKKASKVRPGELVKTYLAAKPDASKDEVIAETGASESTVRRMMNGKHSIAR